MEYYCPPESHYTEIDKFVHVFSVRTNGPQWGMNVVSSSEYGMASVQMKRNLHKLASLGGAYAVFIPVHYQESPLSSNIFRKKSSPSMHSLKNSILFAKRIGLKTSLKPHLNLETREARSRINPLDFKKWGSNYREYILSYARLANELEVDSFFIGTELEGVSKHEEYWRDLIKSVRQEYGGELSYSSNRLGEAKNINWWDSLDFIGISFYEPILSGISHSMTESDLVSAWYYKGYALQLLQLNERWKKNIVLSELGYYGRSDTALNPAIISDGMIDSRAQAIAYSAAYRVLSTLPPVKAFYIWALDANSISPPGGFSIIPTNNVVMCELNANKS